jgi:hypothetical protein
LDAARRTVRLPQFLDDRDDGLVRNLLRSSHGEEVTVNYGKLVRGQHSGFRGTSRSIERIRW